MGRGSTEEIPEVQVPRDPGEVTPQKQISERIPEQIVERGIPQERQVLERIPEQIRSAHGIPQERTSERIPKQMPLSCRLLPQKRTSEQIHGADCCCPRAAEYSSETNCGAKNGADRPCIAVVFLRNELLSE